jgi:hypothetical protein
MAGGDIFVRKTRVFRSEYDRYRSRWVGHGIESDIDGEFHELADIASSIPIRAVACGRSDHERAARDRRCDRADFHPALEHVASVDGHTLRALRLDRGGDQPEFAGTHVLDDPTYRPEVIGPSGPDEHDARTQCDRQIG